MRLIYLLLIVFVVACGESENFRKYEPLVVNDKQQLISDTSQLNSAHLDNLEHVLRYYGIKFIRVSDNELLINDNVDKDTQWNYTTKANDPKWIKEHPVE